MTVFAPQLTAQILLMGYTDRKMTLRYAHLAPSAKAEAVKLLTEKAPNKN
jgi:hypothetical protein